VAINSPLTPERIFFAIQAVRESLKTPVAEAVLL
jgi:hypothetical protein